MPVVKLAVTIDGAEHPRDAPVVDHFQAHGPVTDALVTHFQAAG